MKDAALNAAMQTERTMRERCIECALANTPPNVLYIQPRKSLSGFAATKESIPVAPDTLLARRRVAGRGCLAAPRPFTRKALMIFLHECAHFALHADYKYGKRPRYVEEYEAEQWTISRMRESGIPVPKVMLKRAKEYVAYKLRRVKKKKGRNIDSKLLAFARG
jgi:hypothetical protein